MEFWIVLAAVVVLFAGWPYVRSLFKRIVMACRLKRVCAGRNLRLYPTHPLWMLGGRAGASCDFYIETRRTVYAVKLFGVPRRLSVLIFTDHGQYFIRYYLALISFTTSAAVFPINGRRKNLREYDFRRKYRTEWEIKTPRNILLINPVCREIQVQPDRGGARIIGTGDVLYNCEIQSLTRLISELEEDHE